MQRLQQNYTSIDSMRNQLPKRSPKADHSQQPELSFQDVFRSEKKKSVDNLRFSKHANERLATRNIHLSAEQMERLENGTTKAREKGIRESLVLVDDLAFIVNIKNNTVITAVGSTADSIFTNIDGAVIS